MIIKSSPLKILSISAATLLLSACFESSPIHEAMEEMGDSFKTMKETDELSVVKAEFETFKKSFDIAKAESVKPEEQAKYDEGMKKTEELVTQLSSAIANENLAAAKALLEKLGATRKEYHEALGVK